jgi:Zn finger protein HypA/HybF involved in hydrogenase expression
MCYAKVKCHNCGTPYDALHEANCPECHETEGAELPEPKEFDITIIKDESPE